MAAMVVNPEIRAALVDLRERASLLPIHMPDLVERLKSTEGKAHHRAAMTAQSVAVPVGYLVTFSVETGHPKGPMRHMSMSVDRAGKLPHPVAVWMICEELGFVGGLDECLVWLENLEQGQAVNVIQPIAMMTAGRA